MLPPQETKLEQFIDIMRDSTELWLALWKEYWYVWIILVVLTGVLFRNKIKTYIIWAVFWTVALFLIPIIIIAIWSYYNK